MKESRLRRPDRHLQRRGNLFNTAIIKIPQDNRLAQLLRKPPHRRDDVIAAGSLKELRKRIVRNLR